METEFLIVENIITRKYVDFLLIIKYNFFFYYPNKRLNHFKDNILMLPQILI